MGADNTTIVLHAAPTAVAHDDTDYHAGVTLLAMCADAAVYWGGATVTNGSGGNPGLKVSAGQSFGLTDTTGIPYVCVDPADDGKLLRVFWDGV